MRSLLRTFAAVAAVAMIATACADAPDDTTDEPTTDVTTDDSTEEPTEAATGDDTGDAEALAACQVTDTGGVDDRSFNQTAYDGVLQAEEEFGLEARVLESTTEADFAPNLQTFIEDGDCALVISVGFLLDQATQQVAQENPDQLFAIVDQDFLEFDDDGNFVQDITYDNVRELTFQTDEAAFLAGYLAAGMTETGIVGTYGGLNIPTVTIFMDGFLAGVRHHNDVKGTAVEVLGWDGSEGQFTGNFEVQEDGRNITDQFLANDADIIMPVAGAVGLGTVTAVEDANAGGASAKVIWVDTDGAFSVPQSSGLFLTSVEKGMDLAVFETIEMVVNDSFEGGLYVGTLENGGVSIAPYHDFEDEVPQELKDEVDQLFEDIIGGMSVDPADYGG